MIVEWNAHMFSSDCQRYSFHPQAVYAPPEERLSMDPLAEYLQHMDAEGIERAVLVQPEPYGDDHRLVLDCLGREPIRLKGTCLVFPKDPECVAKMVSLVSGEPRIIALRLHAHRGKTDYLGSFDDANVLSLWGKAADLGLVVELHIGPDYAGQAARAIAGYPDTPVLIDHLCEPAFGSTDEYRDVLALSRFSNVTMKLSGLGHFSQEAEPYVDTGALVRRVAEAFGPDRLAWSSGSPGIVDALLHDWPEGDRAKVKGANLAALAGWA